MLEDNFKIGDKVSVVDEEITGIITRITSEIIYFITTDGFEYNYMRSQLVKSFSASILSNKKITPKDLRKTIIKTQLEHPNSIEIDLHLGQLVDRPNDLEPYQKLQKQIDTARNTIENNLKNKRYKRIIFIHGHGEGILKKNLLDLLDLYHRNCTYFDASYQKYKGGATEVDFFGLNKKNN